MAAMRSSAMPRVELDTEVRVEPDGAPPFAAALLLAYCSNLMAGLTHYGTTPGPIYFGAGYVRQQTWWWLGFVASVPNIVIWATVGFLWWKLLGWW